jgi:hypothetical protein
VKKALLGQNSLKPLLLVCVFVAVALTDPHPASGWDDEGHKVIARIAEHYLDPAVRTKVATRLAADTDTLTGHDIASRGSPRVRPKVSACSLRSRRTIEAQRQNSSLLTRRWRKPDSNLWFRISGKRFFYIASEPQTGREPQPVLTTDNGRFTVGRARLAPAMISTPLSPSPRRRQREALPAWASATSPDC